MRKKDVCKRFRDGLEETKDGKMGEVEAERIRPARESSTP